MPLKRQANWRTGALHQFFVSRAKAPQPFAWGANDCALFAADAIQSFTGVDIAADFRGSGGRGKYSTEAEAFALIQAVTGSTAAPATAIADAAEYCATKHGLTEWPSPRLAQAGDLVVMQSGANLIAGVVHLNGRDLVSVSAEGAVRISILQVVRAWHV